MVGQDCDVQGVLLFKTMSVPQVRLVLILICLRGRLRRGTNDPWT